MTAAHTHSRIIDFAETDAAGIVHFSNFFRFMESAEAAFLRSLGGSPHEPSSGYAWPRIHADCQFQHPAHFGDQLDSRVYVCRLGQSSIDYGFAFWVGAVQVAQGGYTVVHVQLGACGNQRRAAPLPAALRAKLEALVDPTGVALRPRAARERTT